MKLSFSTRGWTEFSWEEMQELAVHKANVEEILGADLTRGEKKKEQRLE